VLRQVQQVRADVLHLHIPNPTMVLALSLAGIRLPVVITYHRDVIRQKLVALLLHPFEPRVFGTPAQDLSHSPAYHARSRRLQQHLEKLVVLPMGIDLEPYRQPSAAARAFARRLRAEHGTPLWLTVGRLVYYKGLHVALEALQHVPGKLIVIGTGPLQAE